MIAKDNERASFKEILDILDPDLSADFKQSSYYHNDYKKKLFSRTTNANRKKFDAQSSPNDINEILDSIKIVEPFIGNSDNYM